MRTTGCKIYNKKVISRWIGCRRGTVGFRREVENNIWENRLYQYTSEQFPPATIPRNWMSFDEFKSIVDNYAKKPICQ